MENCNPTNPLVRYVLRKVRREKGLRLKDLEDYHISAASISNLERGEVKSRDEIFDYLLKKLGLTQESLGKLVEVEKETIEELRFTLSCVESLLEQNLLASADELLESMQMEEFHPLAPLFAYLKGFYYRQSRNVKIASKRFNDGLRFYSQHKLEPPDNIIAACYNQLSICSFSQNNFSEALEYVNKGLEVYDGSLKRADIKYSLLIETPHD